jgi:hypothetical protein
MISEHKKQYIKTWLLENREKHLAQQKEWRDKNSSKRNEYEKKRREGFREQALAHYGQICSCCGETKKAFLCIDHINGGGEAHRREIGISSGTGFLNWLVKNDFPDGFRTLCHNCNFCIWAHGQCVHKGPPTKTGGPRYEYMQKHRTEIRHKTFSHYGEEKCVRCGETKFEFLVLDHIDGGGKKHQKEVGRGSCFYRWLVKNNYPPGFQILCHNCNAEKH